MGRMAVSQEAIQRGSRWRTRALDRSLEPAATRSMERLERILDAARELADATEDASFTVAEVAERAGVSLKSFYRSFTGKDDLLLALLEEDSRAGATMVRHALDRTADADADPGARVERYVRTLFKLAREAPGYSRVLVQEHRRLSVERPVDLAGALAPLVDLLKEEIAAGTAVADPKRSAEIVFAVLLDGLADVTLAGRESKEVVASVWQFVAGGLRLDTKETS